VHIAADFTTTNELESAIPWEVADFDDAGGVMWSASNPTRLVPPPGVTRLRLTAGIRWEGNSSIGYRIVKIKANNAAGYYPLNAIFASDSRFPDAAPGVSSCTLTTGIIDVRDINYFELTVQQDSGADLDVYGTGGAQPQRGWGTFFQMEVVNAGGVSPGGVNDYAATTNNSGNTIITPTAPNYGFGLTIGGSARTSIIVLDTAGRIAGDAITIGIALPATTAIVLEVRNATSGGTLLLPAEIFASQQYTTDGIDRSATWEFVFTGTAWKYVLSNIPA